MKLTIVVKLLKLKFSDLEIYNRALCCAKYFLHSGHFLQQKDKRLTTQFDDNN
jgi:hypothetical protein